MLFIHLSHWNVSNHMKIVQEIEILEDSITWTVPSGPSRPGSFMISTISSMMLFSPGNIWWYYIISCICFIEELLQYLAFWIQSSLMILRTDQTYYYWSSQCRNPCLWMNNSSSSLNHHGKILKGLYDNQDRWWIFTSQSLNYRHSPLNSLILSPSISLLHCKVSPIVTSPVMAASLQTIAPGPTSTLVIFSELLCRSLELRFFHFRSDI